MLIKAIKAASKDQVYPLKSVRKISESSTDLLAELPRSQNNTLNTSQSTLIRDGIVPKYKQNSGDLVSILKLK